MRMDVKEKLIEILSKPIFPHELVDPTEAVADYLLDSGVTVQEWVSADDRLPDEPNQGIAHPNAYHLTNYATIILREAPTVDAVEVVRCLECKQGEVDDPDFPDQYYCHAGCGWNNGDFYCAYGERKEGADNEP